MASKRPLPAEAALLEFLDVAEAEQDATADVEMPYSVHLVIQEASNGAKANVPAIGQLPLRQDFTGCYLAGVNWIRAGIVH